ncbi:MAG TPA: ATP-binding protein [Pseudonocardiaceae bacterium]|nr:ATP-binding protein [Pseudonocardiaceae bacterium]
MYRGQQRGTLAPISPPTRPGPAQPATPECRGVPTPAGRSALPVPRPAELQLQIPAQAEHIAAVRRAVSTWATQTGLDADTVEELVLATHEALANTVDHAYPHHPGRVWVTAQCTESYVLVIVGDHGRWRPPPVVTGRGRGLLLIRHLAHHVELDHGPQGTTVRMTWRTGPTPR